MQIAPLQKQQLDFLRDILTDLERTVGRDARPRFNALREKLDDWAAKIAVIGQVKAGKSTFLNAFIQHPDFLPSDVNPWTSVVTNMRINVPGDPAMGAVFEFFGVDDWDEIINGNSDVRKLTEQLLPGFDSNLLRKQSEEMIVRAQKRLGRHYHALLGSKHEYDFLTADLLKRYVCAGPTNDEGIEYESLGRYASVTKVANAYMRLPEFQVPAILTDTPGVNDPFLVRDEFTCRSLDNSDVFIIILSAHQALTEVDVALIRILAQQENKDVIIFINRIDELDEYAREVPRVVDDVTARLMSAIPDIEFTILAGSAYMADLALRNDPDARAARDQIDDDQLRAYLEARYGYVPETQAERLTAASGLPEIKHVLSTVIDNGVGCQQINQLLSDVRAEISGVQFATKRERNSVQVQVERIGAQQAEVALSTLEAEIETIQEVRSRLEESFETVNGQLEKIVMKSWTNLERQLNEQVELFVDNQRGLLYERLLRNDVSGKASRMLHIDLLPLQRNLERAVTSTYGKARAGMDVALNNCMHSCLLAIRERFDEPTEGISLESLPYDEFVSTLTLSKRTLDLEMIVERGWTFWKRPNVNIDKSHEALRAIAAAELKPAINKLLRACNEAQIERAHVATKRIGVMLRMFDSALTERSQRLRKDKRLLENAARGGVDTETMAHRLQSQLEVLERRLQHLSITDSHLSKAVLSNAA